MTDGYTYRGNTAWSGVVSLLDGVIEETFTLEYAQEQDFHHSCIVSPAALERMHAREPESAYFWVNDGVIEGVAGFGGAQDDLPEHIIARIREQVSLP